MIERSVLPMKKRIAAMLLAAALCLGLIFSSGASASAFSDVTDPGLAEAVAVLSGLGVVDGYSDGGFHPDDALTRAQFCKLIVTAIGKADKASSSGYRALFSDLPTSHWAVGYVNLAYDQGLISGYGDGAFGPEDPVDLSQAVTIVLKALGYTTADIGPFWPEDYLAKAADLGLSGGISSAGSLTRGEAALLLYAMLRADNAQGKVFWETLAAGLVASALVMDNNAEGPDGTAKMLQVYANGTVSYHEQAGSLPKELVGCRGTLLLNSGGRVMGMLPDDRSYKSVSLSEVTAKGLIAVDGSFYAVSSSVPVVLKGEKTTFEKAWYSMGSLSSAVLYYNASGAVDLVWAGAADAGELAYVVTVSSGAETLLKSVFSVSGTVSVRKNGVEADFSAIAPYDVVTYDPSARTFMVSDRKVTGYYENASPNTQAPNTVTLLGADFNVLDRALDTLDDFAVGDRMTILLTADGAVAAAYAASEVKGDNIGIYNGEIVTLADGTVLSGVITGGGNLYGSVVKVSASAIGKLTISAASGSSLNGSLNVSARTLGKYSLAPGVVIYDQVDGASAVRLTLSDLKMSTLSSGKISSAILDGSGQVAYLFLDDATGDCYTYGMLTNKKVSGGNAEEGTDYSYNTVSVTNSDGAGKYYNYLSSVKTVGGLAVTGSGSGVRVAELTRLKANRSDIVISSDGESYVTAGGSVWPVSDGVQVYNTKSKLWTTLEEALAFTDAFSVYYDRAASEGGQIRLIYAE